MEPLEFLLCLAVVAWVIQGMAVRIGIVGTQPQVNTDRPPRRLMLDGALSLDRELAVVAIRSAHEAHPLDLVDGEGFDPLLLVPDQPERADAAAVREGDVLAVRRELPARLLVLDGAVVMLEAGIALLTGFVVHAILIEARDGEPGARGGGLPGLGVEPAGKGERFGKLGAQALQVVLAGAAHLHPEPERLVPDELDDAHGLLDGGLLRLCSIYLVFVDEHRSSRSLPVFIVSPCILFRYLKSGNAPDPSPEQGTLFIPGLKDRGFQAISGVKIIDTSSMARKDLREITTSPFLPFLKVIHSLDGA